MNAIRTLAALAFLCPLAIAAVAWPSQAQEVPPCGTVAVMFAAIGNKYGEVPESIFVSAVTKLVMTLLVNRKSGTWTLMAQRTPDAICMVDAGELFGNASDALKKLAKPGKDT